MEDEVSSNDSNGSTSSMTDNNENECIASPDPVEVTAEPSETLFREDDRSQTPLQDEVGGGGGDEHAAEITGSVEEVNDTSQPPQQDVTSADLTNSYDDEVLKQTIRDDHGELDYDEEVQPDGCPVVTTIAGSSSNRLQKAADDEEREEGEERDDPEEKVANCFCYLCQLNPLTQGWANCGPGPWVSLHSD